MICKFKFGCQHILVKKVLEKVLRGPKEIHIRVKKVGKVIDSLF